MDVQYLIKGGMIIDGSGAPAFRGDVRVRQGKIVRIGADLPKEGRERVIDAADCYVTPGFVEAHNHWDAGMWWAPMMEPLAAYGVTTSINGNCGFSAAPMHPDPAVRHDMMDIFNYFEDIPEKAQAERLPWDWRKWSEYKASLQRNVKVPVNFASFCGHIPLRLTVMGAEAWTRVATAGEIAEMCELLEDALSAGALGMSSNLLDYDKWERPVPSQVADDAEWAALLKVLARHPGATLQVIVDNFMRMTGPDSVERLGRLAKEAGVRMQWVGVPALKFQAKVYPRLQELHEGFKAEGLDFWTGYHHVSPTSVINFISTLVFGQNGNPVWQEVINEKDEDKKLAMLADEAWRDRARESWDNQYAHSYLNDPSAMTLRESETGYGPLGVTLADYMATSGINHTSDAMAEWVLTNGVHSVIYKKSWELDEQIVLDLLRDPRSVGNLSDSGAHGKLFCGGGDNVLLLTDYVRDRKLISIEEAVHVMTGKLTNFFGLHDRGLLREGMAADIAVFNLAEIERRPEEKVWDVPDGEGGRTYRYSRAAAPMRLTLCNGVATFDNGAVTGTFPGRYIGPGPDPSEQQALAAE
jgi:N-acyl-D-aspartate/D-glutamate deacylase